MSLSSLTATRRGFFRAAGAGLAGFRAALAAASGDEGRWAVVRGQFAFTEQRVPMNAANLCPTPRAVADEVTRLTADIDLDCSFQNRAKFADSTEKSREKAAALLGVSPDEVALVRNTSESNNTVNNGLNLRVGDEIVIWEQNHPTNNVAWQVRARRFGYAVKSVATPAAPNSVDELIEPFRRALGPKTRVLALTHASNSSGQRLPVAELAELARGRGIWVHVDGAQSWGALDVNPRKLGFDSYSASAHKWYCGPKEVGLLWVRAEGIERLWPNVVAPGWGDGADTVLKGARKFESMGQRDDAALAALGATADIHAALGTDAIDRRVMELAERLKAGLAEAGARLVTPRQAEFSAGVVIVDVPAAKRQEALDKLYLEHGIAGSTSGGLRLCPHIYNTAEHVDRAVAGVRALRKLWA